MPLEKQILRPTYPTSTHALAGPQSPQRRRPVAGDPGHGAPNFVLIDGSVKQKQILHFIQLDLRSGVRRLVGFVAFPGLKIQTWGTHFLAD